jgi:hypothetical protein
MKDCEAGDAIRTPRPIRFRLNAHVCFRLFWLLMGLSHTPALAAGLRSLWAEGMATERLGGCILLWLSMAFFALKVADVAFLRFRVDRRSVAAFCMIVALLHVRTLSPDAGAMMLPAGTSVVVASLLAGKLIHERRRRVLASLCARPNLMGRSSVAWSHNIVWCDEFRPHCWVLSSRLYSLRAPPV